jgi:Ca-activated chloride channel homolog
MRAHRCIGVVAALMVGLMGATLHSRPQQHDQQTPAAVFSAQSELVVLHVTVTDRYRTYVAGLERDAFTVFEDDRSQAIQLFSVVDAPVTVGLLVDNSASMYGMRDLVVAAAGAFAATSNPHDEIFALTFNDTVRPVLPRTIPFTSSPVVLQGALASAITARGRTALHDAIAEGLTVLATGRYSRRILILVSDGEDTASAVTYEEIQRRTDASNTSIYAIALRDPGGHAGRADRLKQLATATGGQLFRPQTRDGIDKALRTIARDIRNTYTVGYVPSNTPGDGSFRRIRVLARGPDGEVLHVRTREGYAVERR